MQGFFVQYPEILNSCNFLSIQDGAFFHSKVELALRNVRQISPSSAFRLAKIMDSYEQVVRVLESQPLTLVHGGYIPWHILLDFKRKPTRVCAVDWESAAYGLTLYDLAYFTDGMEPQPLDRIMDAYRRAAVQHSVPVPLKPRMKHILDCLRLHRTFDWLSRSIEKRFTENKVEKLLDRAEQLMELTSV